MGIYVDLEYEFIDRTIKLLLQYQEMLHKNDVAFKQQYNYTLLLNCMLGVIVMPKERAISSLPTDRLTMTLRKKMGIEHSTFNPEIKNQRDLIKAMRNCVAHFSIEVVSLSEEKLIDEIVFFDSKGKARVKIAHFKANELMPFIMYVGTCIMDKIVEQT